jgi:hypothetical protein
MKVSKAIKASHPHTLPRGGGLGLLATLDTMNSSRNHRCLKS